MIRRSLPPLVLCGTTCVLLAFAFCLPAGAASFAMPSELGFYAELGRSPGNSLQRTDVVSLGYVVDVPGFGGRGLSAYLDGFISVWRADRHDGQPDRNLVQFGHIAALRYRFAQGRARWFVDAGVGLTYADRHYRAPSHFFSTRFQFTEIIGIGLRLDRRARHELSLRFQHVSNAGIRKPNPGEDFGRLRYVYRF